MKSRTTKRFRAAFSSLPQDIQERAREAYALFVEDPAHPSLRFKKVHTKAEIFSARITSDYRALAVQDEDTLVWFWIGSHDDYERLLKRI